MCTGVMINSQDLQTAFIAGAIDYIRKPVDKIELIARVRSMLMLADYFSQKNIAENKIIDLKREIQEQEINRLQTELDFKNKELTSKAMFLIQKDEILITLKEKLIEFSKSVNKELSSKISDLIKDLNLQQNDNRWKEFEVHFENVHEEFYNRLKLKNPDLTANDKKLCAFIRLNMSTKEICALTHQSVKSIEVARTRLRQKLNLSRDESLNTFISLI
jgi:DNA-binding NarL/FixJ family response regulator